MNREYVVKGTNNGYEYFIDYSHPLATGNSGRVYVHRHIASMMGCKWLDSSEVVHHIDGDKLNNTSSNLEILSNSEHAALHRGGALLEISCPTCTKIFKPTSRDQKVCSLKCKVRNTEITKEMLDALIPKTSWVALGKLFGYTDNGIKKRAIALGCDIKRLKEK